MTATPSNEDWQAMSEQERARVAAQLRSDHDGGERFADRGDDAAGLGLFVDESEVAL